MGLDSYWCKTPEERPVEIVFDPPLNLCGGMLSGTGAGSFRGKVYATIIEEISGVSIYNEWLDTDTISKIAADLEATEWVPRFEQEYGIGKEEFNDLGRMFGAYAFAKCGLYGWW